MPELHILVIEHDFAHPPETIWRAWTEPDQLASWVWGKDRKSDVEIDLRRGGRWQAYADFPEQKGQWRSERMGQLGMFLEVDPPKRLVFTTHWDAPVGYNQVEDPPAIDEVITLDLAPSQRGCLMRYEHLGVPDAQSVSAHETAMKQQFAMLDGML